MVNQFMLGTKGFCLLYAVRVDGLVCKACPYTSLARGIDDWTVTFVVASACVYFAHTGITV